MRWATSMNCARCSNGQPKPACAALTPFTILDGVARSDSCSWNSRRSRRSGITSQHPGRLQRRDAGTVLSIGAYAMLRQWLPTVEIKSSFVESIPIGRCIGEGRVIKAGRRLAFVEGRLTTRISGRVSPRPQPRW
jgi:hypothetical protein